MAATAKAAATAAKATATAAAAAAAAAAKANNDDDDGGGGESDGEGDGGGGGRGGGSGGDDNDDYDDNDDDDDDDDGDDDHLARNDRIDGGRRGPHRPCRRPATSNSTDPPMTRLCPRSRTEGRRRRWRRRCWRRRWRPMRQPPRPPTPTATLTTFFVKLNDYFLNFAVLGAVVTWNVCFYTKGTLLVTGTICTHFVSKMCTTNIFYFCILYILQPFTLHITTYSM